MAGAAFRIHRAIDAEELVVAEGREHHASIRSVASSGLRMLRSVRSLALSPIGQTGQPKPDSRTGSAWSLKRLDGPVAIEGEKCPDDMLRHDPDHILGAAPR